ncbi:hypothetical protein CBS147332_7395 [Penicillium roqueforti]|nr:hypothetical protein CBS147332_7395 [Penicillium roqueforti]KAI3097755.1 hypothetical protein CBS147331_8952 [Penicillium roqueforti]KAI3198419.1 hypothetical protein CBS147311_6445 [Penicillium roqueforti]
MPIPSGHQGLDIPMITDEDWDADDEDSGSDTTSDSFDLVPMSTALKPEDKVRGLCTNPLFHFTVHREEHTFPGQCGKSDGWINTSHFLWAMCATLADSGTDPEWAATFEEWRPQWNKIQAQVKRFGYTHFSSEIAPAPVDLVLVQFFGWGYSGEPREFEIEQEDPDSVYDCQDMWTFWRYIIETPASQIRQIVVCLKDTARLVGSE